MTERDTEDQGLVDRIAEVAGPANDEGRLPGEGINPAGDVSDLEAGGEVGTTVREPAPTGEPVGTTIREPAPLVEEDGTTIRDLDQPGEESGVTVRAPFPDEE